jgi:hypothetical protein
MSNDRLRLLFVSPHFPPDSSAGTHRARLLAPHLAAHGVDATILTVDPRDYEGSLDEGLSALVPATVMVRRVRAWSPRWTRRVGLGDLGLRALVSLRAEGDRMLAHGAFDAVCVTMYPTYPAWLLPGWRLRHRVATILDWQDPWVSAWGDRVGPRRDGSPDLKSRVTRSLAVAMEPRVVRTLDAMMSVSQGTLDAVIARTPSAASLPSAIVPIGCDSDDVIGAAGVAQRVFDSRDGLVHVCYVGTLLPLAHDPMRAVLRALSRLRETEPSLANRVRVHCVGTGNQTGEGAPMRVRQIAESEGVADIVTEAPTRVPYLQALALLRDASAVLVVGSTEPHYTASKLYPALLAERPLLVHAHGASQAMDVLRGASGAAGLFAVPLGDGADEALIAAWRAIAAGPPACAPAVRTLANPFEASVLAGDVAALVRRAVAHRAGRIGAAQSELAHA